MPILSLLLGRSTVRTLHQTAARNLVRNHRTRSGASVRRAASTSTSATTPRTIPLPSWPWLSPLTVPFRAYSRMQARSPLLTQFETSLIIYFLGDLSSQSISTRGFSDEGTHYEPARALRVLFIAATVSIPSYKWFMFLGNHFNYASHWASIGVKIVISQTFFTPVFNTYFFGMQALLSGGTLREAAQRVKETVPTSFWNSWKVWPAVTAFSFTYLPMGYRPVFAGSVAVVWQGYLGWLNKRAEMGERREVEGPQGTEGKGAAEKRGTRREQEGGRARRIVEGAKS